MSNEEARYTLTCTCGKYIAEFGRDQLTLAEQDAIHHLVTEQAKGDNNHVVTCTRPAHWDASNIHVIVFVCKDRLHN